MRHDLVVVNLFLDEFSLVGRHGIAREQSSYVLSKSIVEAALLDKHVLMLLIELDLLSIIQLG